MATETFYGYQAGDFSGLGTSNTQLDPAWDSSTHGYSFEFTDDDGNLDGDLGSPNTGDDAGQTVVVRDSAGNVVSSGQAYVEGSWDYTDENGNPQKLYAVYSGGSLLGYVATGPVQPGTVFTTSNYSEPSSVAYSDLDSNTYTQASSSTIKGGSGNDSLAGGAGNDSITSDSGADTIDGGSGNDTLIYGQGGATSADGDSVSGGDGDDLIDDISGSAGWVYDDTLDGGAGNDTIYAGSGNDLVYGGSGNDYAYGEDGDDTIDGGSGSDRLDGGNGNDVIYGGDDGDWIEGGSGNDLLEGQGGSDSILAGSGNDTVRGGDGNDYLYGDSGDDSLDGGADGDMFFFASGWGNDTITGGESTTTGPDFDTLNFWYMSQGVTVTATGDEAGTVTDGTSTATYTGIEGFYGSSYNDSLRGDDHGSGFYADMGAGNDTVGGGAGNDTIYGGEGNDTIYGAAGNDYLVGGGGSNSINGASGNDTIVLTSTDGISSIYGGTETDTLILSGAGANVVWAPYTGGTGTVQFGGGPVHSFWEIEEVDGTAYNDTFDASAALSEVSVNAGDGNDSLTGSALNDTLNGGNGNDTIDGGDGDDVISGGAGDDLLSGGLGDDALTLGTGADTVVFQDAWGNDTIADFDMTDDGGGLTIDQLDVSDLTDADGNPVNVWDVTVTSDGSGGSILTFPNGESLTLTGIDPSTLSTTAQLHAMGIPCLVAGVEITTPQGARRVEDLRPGDRVCLAQGGTARVQWVGQRRLEAEVLRASPKMRPVEIRAGAFGPHGAVRLSPLHAVHVPEGPQGALVRARHLADSGWDGARHLLPEAEVTYVHVLLDQHGVMLAEGLPVESFWPGPFGFASLAPLSRLALLCARPDLAAALFGEVPVASVYGPEAAPLLPRKAVTAAACRRWATLTALKPTHQT
ncbi:Hint domain-containing protein [Arenibacterium sp. LLYu02]|uniref:Hint domain-containing protein n=1 Tax=Arenibacterium sp. LLYu02 TaxID=3404132 RepID=UPI003B21FD04